MKKIIILLVLLIVLIPSKKSLASHFAGADLTYTCLGGTSYLITLSFYKDCGGIASPMNASVSINCSTNSNFSFTATLTKIAGTGQEITNGCASSPTSCGYNGGVNGNGPYGIQEFVYQATVQLPPCSHWDMHWTSAARNPVTTLFGTSNWFIPAYLNNLDAAANSSPTFTDKPITVICNNTSYSISNNIATDVDGDSLVYSLYAPYTTSLTASVTYMSPYSYTDFMPSSTPITLDSLTGMLSLSPTTTLNTVLGIKVEEWRVINDTARHIGTIYRDASILVTTCTNNDPQLSGMDTTLSSSFDLTDSLYYLESCLSNDSIKFNIYGNDIDSVANSTNGNPGVFTISCDNPISGARYTFRNNNTDSAYLEFAWLPTTADVGSIPHCFSVDIADSACTYYGTNSSSYCINVSGMYVDIGSDTLLCKGESINITAQSSSNVNGFIWSLDSVPISIPLSQDNYTFNSYNTNVGVHKLKIEASNASAYSCGGYDSININVVAQPHFNSTLSDTSFCNNDIVVYDVGNIGLIYSWVINGDTTSTIQSDTIDQSGNYIVMVDGGNGTRCIDSDTFSTVIDSCSLSFAGADLTYTSLGGTSYLVTLSFYKTCGGAPAPNDVNISFNCTSDSLLGFTAILNKIAGTGQEITSSCSSAPTSCSSGFYKIQEFVYQKVIQISPCNNWEMYWTGGHRSPITTVNSGDSWLIPASLNNLQAFANSSPTFSNKPFAIACNNQSVCFNPGAIDPDGDSLVYSFYAPYTTSFGVSVIYNTPYSASNFINSSTPITLDAITGDICFTPTAIQSSVIGIKVDEWRKVNGVQTKIGTVYRDMQLKVKPCSNNIPVLSGMDASLTSNYNTNDTVFFLNKCISPDTIKFHINGFDADAFDPNNTGNPEIFNIEWNNGIDGAIFTPHNNGTDSAYAEFKWLPTEADVSTMPKCFTATIYDEACPYYGKQTHSFCIMLKGGLVDLGSDTLLCEGESITVNAQTDSTVVNYIWSLDGSPTSTPTSQDSFIVNSSILGVGIHVLSVETNDGTANTVCPTNGSININVVSQPNININILDTNFCNNDIVVYDVGNIGMLYSWVVNGDTTSTIQLDTIDQSGNYIVMVDGGNGTRCVDSDTFSSGIYTSPAPFSLGNDITIFSSQSISLSLPTHNYYYWSTGSNNQSIIIDNTFLGLNTIIGRVSDNQICFASDTIIVNVIIGIKEVNEENILVYPNPVSKSMTISLQKSYRETEYLIHNVKGELIQSGSFSGKECEILSLGCLSSGMYILTLRNTELNTRVPFMKE